jgi:hypothetical protein
MNDELHAWPKKTCSNGPYNAKPNIKNPGQQPVKTNTDKRYVFEKAGIDK